MRRQTHKIRDWTPPSRHSHTLDCYNNCFRKKADSKILNKSQNHNVSPSERKAMKFLRYNSKIAIKPVDKAGAELIVLNCQDYINEANRQLSDIKYFKELWEDPTPLFALEQKNIIKSLPHQLQE